MEDGSVEIYSRNAERNTEKYIDVVEELPRYFSAEYPFLNDIGFPKVVSRDFKGYLLQCFMIIILLGYLF